MRNSSILHLSPSILSVISLRIGSRRRRASAPSIVGGSNHFQQTKKKNSAIKGEWINNWTIGIILPALFSLSAINLNFIMTYSFAFFFFHFFFEWIISHLLWSRKTLWKNPTRNFTSVTRNFPELFFTPLNIMSKLWKKFHWLPLSMTTPGNFFRNFGLQILWWNELNDESGCQRP